MAKLPKQVEAFNQTLERFVSVQNVATGLKWLSEFEPKVYSFPGEFGDMPHALLRRTDGGLPDEVWIPTEFELTQDTKSWVTLEFLAWWVRDCSRGGVQIQLRPMAFPPMASADQVQLGITLKFIIDQFAQCPGQDVTSALERMQEAADSLSGAIDMYREVLDDLIAD